MSQPTNPQSRTSQFNDFSQEQVALLKKLEKLTEDQYARIEALERRKNINFRPSQNINIPINTQVIPGQDNIHLPNNQSPVSGNDSNLGNTPSQSDNTPSKIPVPADANNQNNNPAHIPGQADNTPANIPGQADNTPSKVPGLTDANTPKNQTNTPANIPGQADNAPSKVPGVTDANKAADNSDKKFDSLEDLIKTVSGAKKDSWYDALEVFHGVYMSYATLRTKREDNDSRIEEALYIFMGKALKEKGVFKVQDIKAVTQSELFKDTVGNVGIEDNNKMYKEIEAIVLMSYGKKFYERIPEIIKGKNYASAMGEAKKILAKDEVRRVLGSLLMSQYKNNMDDILKLKPEELYTQSLLASAGSPAKIVNELNSEDIGKQIYSLLTLQDAKPKPAEAKTPAKAPVHA